MDSHLMEMSSQEFLFLRDLKHKILSGRWVDPVLIDFIGDRGGADESTAFILGQIIYLLHTGGATLARYPIGGGPCRDGRREENEERLAVLRDWAPHVYRQDSVDCDGSLTCQVAHSVPVLRWKWHRGDWKTETIGNHIVESRRVVPLEIGDTAPATTCAHLMQERVLARWPYGHNAVTIVFILDHDWGTVQLD